MKHETLLTCTALLLGMLLLPAMVLAQKTYLTGDLEPGPYEVGFKLVHEYDYTRYYKPTYSDQGVLEVKASPRPMQIGIWYPAEKAAGNSYLKYRDYYYMDATVEDFDNVPDETERLNLDRQFQYQRIFTAASADPDILHGFLDLETRALRDARAISGSFPLVIYSPREYRGIYYNSQLIENLVSHGYIVAVTPNKDRVDAVRQSQLTADVLMVNIEDLQFVKGYALNEVPHVNKEKVGVVGWSWGAMPALGFAMQDPHVGAVVSLDGLTRFPQMLQTVQNLPAWQATNVTAPLLHFESRKPANANQQVNPVDFTFYDDVQYADAYHLEMNEGTWFSMSSYFNIVHGKGANLPAQFDYEAIDRSYDAISTYTLHFLNAYLKGDHGSHAYLQNTPASNGFSEDFMAMKMKEGLPKPPTEAFFVNYFLAEGPEKGLAMWNMVKERDPNYVLATPASLNGIGYQFIQQGDIEAGVVALKLQADTYPAIANAWDSLGEAYMANGDDDLAIEAFQRALTMNPQQATKQNSISLLDQLGVTYEPPAPYAITAEEAAPMVGKYDFQVNNNAMTAEVKWDGSKLTMEIAGQPVSDLIPKSDCLFWVETGGNAAGMSLEFVKDDTGHIKEVLIEQQGFGLPVQATAQPTPSS